MELHVAEQSLTQIIKQHGTQIIDDPGRLTDLLNASSAGTENFEKSILVTLLQERAPRRLLAWQPGVPLDEFLHDLAREVEGATGLNAGMARWGVRVWARALSLPLDEAAIAPAPATLPATAASVPTPVRTATCFRCGLTTIAPGLLRRVETMRGPRLYCPRCIKARQAPQALAGLVVFALGTAVLAAWLFDGRYLNGWPGVERFAELALVAALTNAGLLVLHEAAHATVALIVGFRVPEISIGLGPRIFRRRFIGTLVDVRAVPCSGWCRYAPRDTSPARWRLMCVVGAGLAMHLLFIAIIIAMADGHLALFRGPAGVVWAMVLYTNVCMLIGNAIPRRLKRVGPIWNDGKKLLALSRAPINSAGLVTAANLIEIRNYIEAGKIAVARERFRQTVSDSGTEALIRGTELYLLAAEGRWPDIEARVQLWAQSRVVTDRVWLSWLAVALVYQGKSLVAAQECCDEVSRIVPWDAAAQNVQALVYIAQHRHDLAEEFMRCVGNDVSALFVPAAAAYCWAEIYRNNGDTARECKWRRIALEFDRAGALAIPIVSADN